MVSIRKDGRNEMVGGGSKNMTDWQQNLEAMVETIDAKGHDWTAWELEFLESMKGKQYHQLSYKQQAIVERLWEKS